jgi:hypothetical protein
MDYRSTRDMIKGGLWLQWDTLELDQKLVQEDLHSSLFDSRECIYECSDFLLKVRNILGPLDHNGLQVF